MKYQLLTLVLTATVSHMVLADEITRVNLGHQVLRVSQPLNVEFANQAVTIPPLCKTDCKDVTVQWKALASQLTTSTPAPGVYLFDSGVKGIALQITAPDHGAPVRADQALTLNIGLVRTSPAVAAGELNLATPLLQWTLINGSKGSEEVLSDRRGQVLVNGTLTAGSCEPAEGNLTFRLPPVLRADLQNTQPSQPVKGVEAKQSIAVSCTPGVASKLIARFLATTPSGNPSIVLSDENPGVGFVVTDDIKNQKIQWDRTQPLEYPIPSTGQTSIPLTAFYTPTGQKILTGRVSAQAQFTIDYQ